MKSSLAETLAGNDSAVSPTGQCVPSRSTELQAQSADCPINVRVKESGRTAFRQSIEQPLIAAGNWLE
ncbi:hypothetical protein RRSWK_05224 [Rhodopirellula sp. SWK7]|nr:hypothetical protein RRSWK_05224 [Rhodopirellula sp. SWK7]